MDKRGDREVLTDERDDAVVDALTVSNNFCVGVVRPVVKGVIVMTGVSVSNAVSEGVAVGSDDTYAVIEGLLESIEENEAREVITLTPLFIDVLEMLRMAERECDDDDDTDILDRTVLDINGLLVDEYVTRIDRVSDAPPVIETDTTGDFVPLLDVDGDRDGKLEVEKLALSDALVL